MKLDNVWMFNLREGVEDNPQLVLLCLELLRLREHRLIPNNLDARKTEQWLLKSIMMQPKNFATVIDLFRSNIFTSTPSSVSIAK